MSNVGRALAVALVAVSLPFPAAASDAAETAAPLAPSVASPTPSPTPTASPSPSPSSPAVVERVTIEANRTRIHFGGSVKLSGVLESAMPAEREVLVVDDDEQVVAEATTDDEGRYQASLSPQRNVSLRARAGATESKAIRIGVRPLVTVSLRRVRLFDRSIASGRVDPPLAGEQVTVKLFRWSKRVATKTVATDERGRYRARFSIRRPGRYRVKASITPADLLTGHARSRRRQTPLPDLGPGSHSIFVKLLEKRLRGLRYHLPSKDRYYDYRTADAVIAFNKVQGVARSGRVDAPSWRRLARPKRPRPRAAKPDMHIEIDQTKQVLYVVRRGAVRRILHTSTGRNGWTHDGVYRVFRKVSGYSPGRLYYPSYFDGLRAVHGWSEVPTYPASHGCARVPMWAAKWIHGVMDIGTEVRVYH